MTTLDNLVAASDLSEKGFALYDLSADLGVSESDERFTRLLAEFDNLPADPYATEAGRYRRYARGVLIPWTGEFTWAPIGGVREQDDEHGFYHYYQGNNNPEFPGMTRELPAITEATRNNTLMTDLILFDFDETRWNDFDRSWPMHVGVHMVTLCAEESGREAVSSPNELHQDGEPYVFAHLMERRNVDGGRNVVATPECRGKVPEDVDPGLLLADFELTKPLESYGVRDDRVTHYVAPVRKGPAPGPGLRSIILTDFTPMTQRI